MPPRGKKKRSTRTPSPPAAGPSSKKTPINRTTRSTSRNSPQTPTPSGRTIIKIKPPRSNLPPTAENQGDSSDLSEEEESQDPRDEGMAVDDDEPEYHHSSSGADEPAVSDAPMEEDDDDPNSELTSDPEESEDIEDRLGAIDLTMFDDDELRLPGSRQSTPLDDPPAPAPKPASPAKKTSSAKAKQTTRATTAVKTSTDTPSPKKPGDSPRFRFGGVEFELPERYAEACARIKEPFIKLVMKPATTTTGSPLQILSFEGSSTSPAQQHTSQLDDDPTIASPSAITGTPVLAHILRCEGFAVVPYNEHAPGSSPPPVKKEKITSTVSQRYDTLNDFYFRAAGGATGMWLELIVRLPFNLYECEAFRRATPYIEATHGPVVTEEEVNQALGELRAQNDAWVAEAQLRALRELHAHDRSSTAALGRLRFEPVKKGARVAMTTNSRKLKKMADSNAKKLASQGNTFSDSEGSCDSSSESDDEVRQHPASSTPSSPSKSSRGGRAGTGKATTKALPSCKLSKMPSKFFGDWPENLGEIDAAIASIRGGKMPFYWGPIFDAHYKYPFKPLPGFGANTSRATAQPLCEIFCAQWRKVKDFQNRTGSDKSRNVNDARFWRQSSILPRDVDLELDFDFGDPSSQLSKASIGSARLMQLPWVLQEMKKWFGPIGSFWLARVRSLAEEHRKLSHNISASVRSQGSYPGLSIEFIRDIVAPDLFGSFAVTEGDEPGTYLWANGPPQEDGSPADISPNAPDALHYRSQLESGIRRLCETVSASEARTYAEIKAVDIVAEKAFRELDRERLGEQGGRNAKLRHMPLSRQAVEQHYEEFFSILKRYKDHPLPEWFNGFTKAFIKTVDDLWGNLDLPEDIVGLEGAWNALTEHRLAMDLAEEEDTVYRQMRNAEARVNDDSDEEELTDLDPIAGESTQSDTEFGVAHLKAMDGWQLAEYLGILDLQPERNHRLAAEGAELLKNSVDIHEVERDEEGKLKTLEDGSYRRVYQDIHNARTQIRWPYFAEFDIKACFNRELSEQRMKANGPQMADDTHHPLYPRVHQIVAVANILERGYCHNPWSEPMWGTLLADEVGMGKTWIPFMVLTILRYHRKMIHASPTYKPKTRDEIQAFLKESKHSWIGDERKEMQEDRLFQPGDRKGRRHLLLANQSIITNHMAEGRRLLDMRHFVLCTMIGRGTNERGRRQFWDESQVGLERLSAQVNDSEPAELVAFSTYSIITSDAGKNPLCPAQMPHCPTADSFLRRGRIWDSLFLDEVALLRNPDSLKGVAIRRLCEQSCVIVGATATPVYNSVIDVINVGRVLGLPTIVKRGEDRLNFVDIPTDIIGTTVGGGHEVAFKRYDFSSCTEDIKTIADRARADFNTLTIARKKLSKHRSAAADGEGESTAERDARRHDFLATELQAQQRWTDDDNPTGDSPGETSLLNKINIAKMSIDVNAVGPIRERMGGIMVRRSHASIGYDKLPLTDIQATEPELVWIKMGDRQRTAFTRLERSSAERDKQFYVKMRRFLKHPQAARSGYLDYGCPPSAALVTLGDKLAAWTTKQEEQQDARDKEKVVVHIIWTSLLPYFQSYLHSRGLPSASITGKHNALDRKRICDSFAADEDHPADLTVPLCTANVVPRVVPQQSRILFITDVAQTGLNLQRANHIHLFDPSWAYADIVQIIGRINRIGQLREVHAYLYYHEETFETGLYELVKGKEIASKDFFKTLDIRKTSQDRAEKDIQVQVDETRAEGQTTKATDKVKEAKDSATAAKERIRAKKVGHLVAPAVRTFNPKSVVIVAPPVTVNQRLSKKRDPNPPLPLNALTEITQGIQDIAGEVHFKKLPVIGELIERGRWADMDDVLLRHRCRMLANRIRSDRPGAKSFSDRESNSVTAERKAFWSWQHMPYPEQVTRRRLMLATMINDHGHITKRGLTIYPASLLLPTIDGRFPPFLASSDLMKPTTSPLEPFYPRQGLPIMRHLISVVRVLSLQHDQSTQTDHLDSAKDMVWLADKIRIFIAYHLKDTEEELEVDWNAASYILYQLERVPSLYFGLFLRGPAIHLNRNSDCLTKVIKAIGETKLSPYKLRWYDGPATTVEEMTVEIPAALRARCARDSPVKEILQSMLDEEEDKEYRDRQANREPQAEDGEPAQEEGGESPGHEGDNDGDGVPGSMELTDEEMAE